MAFVFETERSNLYSSKEKNQSLGPGQYLPLTEFKFQNPELVPFGVSTNRQFPEKPNSVPGPGTYYHDLDKEKQEKILKNSVKNFISKEEEIKLNKLAKYEPEKGKQERILKKYRENYEILGFNSKVKRFGNKKRLNTPGPGAYSDRKDYKLAKISEQKCLENKEVIYKTNNNRNNKFGVNKNEVYYLNYNKNLVNNDKEKDKDNNKKEKNKLKNKSKIKNNFNTKKEIKKRLEKEQKDYKKDVKYRISSIPSKNNKGYIVEPDTGKLARKANPEAFKIFSGDKDDAVGPGSYELIFPEDWKKTGTSWSKYKWEKDPKKIRPKSSYNVNSINCQIGNYRKDDKKNTSEESTKINSELSNYYKSYTTKQLNYKDPTAHNIDTITEFLKKKKLPSFIPMNRNPGPGFYYDDDLMSSIKKAVTPPLVPKEPYNPDDEILNEIFNSNNHEKEKKIILDFKKEQAENFKKKMLDKLKQTNVPFLSRSERFNLEPYTRPKSSVPKKDILLKNSNLNLMKGIRIQNNLNTNSNNLYNFGFNYRTSESGTISHEISNYSSTNNSSINNNINNIFYNRPQSMSGTFYRKDIRFRERVIEENSKKWIPGPGTYINHFTGTGKSNSIKMNGRYMDIRTCKKYMEKARPKTASLYDEGINKNNYINIDKNPPVGYYDPDRIYTVKQNVLNKLKQGNRTFNSTLLSDRNAIYQFQKNAPNGPGTYFQNGKNNISQNYNGFNTTTLRFEKGGKNNTKEALEKICDNKIELNAVIGSVNDKGEENKNEMIITKKGFSGSKYKNLKKRKKRDIGPGTYEYGLERYPWIKPSFNTKYL